MIDRLLSFIAGLALVATLFMLAACDDGAAESQPMVVSTELDKACAFSRTPRLFATDRAAYERQARQVFDRYGIPYSDHKNYELDHIVPRCIGGADTIRNLWPQPIAEALIKDQEERRICRAVCQDKTMPLSEGQAYFIEGRWKQ